MKPHPVVFLAIVVFTLDASMFFDSAECSLSITNTPSGLLEGKPSREHSQEPAAIMVVGTSGSHSVISGQEESYPKLPNVLPLGCSLIPECFLTYKPVRTSIAAMSSRILCFQGSLSFILQVCMSRVLINTYLLISIFQSWSHIENCLQICILENVPGLPGGTG